MAPLLGRPGKRHPRPQDGRVNGKEGLANRAKKSEVALPVAAVEIIKEDPTGAARLSPMLEKEVFVAPSLEAAVALAVVGRAGAVESRVEFFRGGTVGINRREVRAAAKPAFCRDNMTRIHMRRRNERRAHVSDERDSARPEPRIIRRSRNVLTKLGREFSVDARYVDPDLFEDAPAHDRDRPAAAARSMPLGTLEAAGRFLRWALFSVFVLDRLKCPADPVAQRREPSFGPGAANAIGGKAGRYVGHPSGNSAV